MFKSKVPDEEMCIVVHNGPYHGYPKTGELVIQDCSAAIVNADGRELFIIDVFIQKIWSLVSNRCF